MEKLETEQQQPDFWRDQEHAQAVSQELSDIRSEYSFVTDLEKNIKEQAELLELSERENDNGILQGVSNQIKSFEEQIVAKERELRFDGPHDKTDAIITIQSGAGGTDAQDWAEMLERMYLRFAEARHWPAKIITRSTGEEAGIKHCSFEIKGKYAYGTLKSEHGIHRLVRLSPFNADNLRQTSFARVEVMPKIPEKELPEIDPKDLEFDTFRASGAGGQHVNKTSSAVRVRHIPTGITVECQNERSQAQNKEQALSVLKSKLQILLEEQRAKEISDLKGIVKEAAWGNQIRSYVLHPYKLVKDHRTKVEVTDVDNVLNGDLSAFLD